MNKAILTISLIASLSILGCNKQDASVETRTDDAGNKTKVATLDREELKPYEQYTEYSEHRPVGEDTPEYKKFIDGMRNFYWSSAPINYEILAYDYIDGYATETDSFKRKDLISVNKNKLDEIYKNLPKNKYFSVQRPSLITFNKYDEAIKGFVVQVNAVEGRNSGDMSYTSNVRAPRDKYQFRTISTVGQMNTQTDDWKKSQSFTYIPKNEEEARQIEAELSDPLAEQNLKELFLGRTIGVKEDPSNFAVAPIFMIDGIALVNAKTNKLIFRISKNELGDKYTIQCDSTAKALGIKDIEIKDTENCDRTKSGY